MQKDVWECLGDFYHSVGVHKRTKLVILALIVLSYVRFQLNVQNAVSAQPCVGKLGISHVLLNFLGCNFDWWFENT